MTPADQALVRRKLTVIVRDVRELAVIAQTPLETYRDDLRLRKATERLLQEAVEAAIDVNGHLIRMAGEPPPEDNHASFEQVARLGILPRELVDALAPAAGLRNRIVHAYDTLNDATILESAGFATRLLPRYVAAIEAYLTASDA